LFGAMLVLASLNRFRLTPALEQALPGSDQRGALSALRRSLSGSRRPVPLRSSRSSHGWERRTTHVGEREE
jgi:hypothetical protein